MISHHLVSCEQTTPQSSIFRKLEVDDEPVFVPPRCRWDQRAVLCVCVLRLPSEY